MRNKGLTLIDLLLSIFILAVLTGIAVPSFNYLTALNQSILVKNSILSSLKFSRNHALNEGRAISFCIYKKNECTNENGEEIKVFFSSNKKVIQKTKINTKNLTIKTSLNTNKISFKQDGSSNANSSFIYCDPRHPKITFRITLSMSGRIYLGADKNKDGIIENTDGTAITCTK